MRPSRISLQIVRSAASAVFWTALVGLPVSAIAQLSTRTDAPASIAVPANLVISPGDLVNIEVFNTPELSGKFRVDQTGQISLLQGGVLNLSGLTALQAGQAIEARLREAQIMLDPHVNVFVQEYASQGVIVVGEVKSPGTYTLLGEHSLYGALAAAGGPTTNEGASIIITHQADPEHKVVVPISSPNFSDLQRATRVNPGDTVFVSRASFYYVVGNVGRPGAFPMPSGEPVKILQAIAQADGTQRATADSKASIIRQTTAGPQTIHLDIKKIYKNEQQNVALQADDVLVIPRSGVKAILDTTIPLASAATLNAVINSLVYR